MSPAGEPHPPWRLQTNPHPESACYLDIHRAPFGEEAALADPVGVTLDTEILEDYIG
ncbi:hypothetical protein [Streptomyces sp. NPDC004134]|uniref:hypothetical protein n=1 Tax=Streptomyces sp. NPDC004134 TaxID=3364691 RepID=UPI0036777223